MKNYKKKALQPMKAWNANETFPSTLSISDADKANGSPKDGDMIAYNPNDSSDVWLVAEKFFKENYEPAEKEVVGKSYQNTDSDGAKKNVKDIVFYGDGDLFKLICKASSKNEQWMKSTKAMEIKHVGCVVQVTTQQGDNVSEAVTFVPDVKIEETYGRDRTVISRRLVRFY